MSESLFDLLRSRMKRQVNLLDVGAAGGVIDGWERFGDKARVFCFEARDDEAASISQVNAHSNVRYFPIALSDSKDGLELNVTVNPGCSSVYPPVEELYRRYPANAILRPLTKIRCQTTTIDDFMAEQDLPAIHGIKLDTQGSELDILRKAERALKTCLFLNIEVEFNELYRGQALFCDVDRFLRDRGFVLWRLNNLAHYTTGRVGGELNRMLIGSSPGETHMVPVSHGQLFWGDALYVRAEATATSTASLAYEDAIAAAALATQWRFYDLALEIIRKSGDDDLLRQAYSTLDSPFSTVFPAEILPETLNITWRGTLSSSGIETDFSETDGCVFFGPYIQLPFGEFEATFHFEAIGLGDQPLNSIITFDVANDAIRVAGQDALGIDGNTLLKQGSVTLRFRNESPKGEFEFRIWTTGRPFAGKLIFNKLTLRRV